MIVDKPGDYRLLSNFTDCNGGQVAAIVPRGTILEISHVDQARRMVCGHPLVNMVNWELNVERVMA